MSKKRQADDSLDEPRPKPRKLHKKKGSAPTRSGWTFHDSVGGCIQQIDPVFGQGDEVIVVPYQSSVRAFSTRTSLLLRSMRIGRGNVTGLLPVPNSTDEVFVSTDRGSLERWNWNSGDRVDSYQLASDIQQFCTIDGGSDGEPSIILSIGREALPESDDAETAENDTNQQIAMHFLGRSSNEPKTRIINSKVQQVRNLRASRDGRLVFASCGRQLLVGETRKLPSDTSDDLTYTWYKLDTPDEITCLDIRCYQEDRPDAEVAIGTTGGAIYLYTELVSKLRRIAKKREQARPHVQKLHWHRHPVATVKFSRDGNYLISGGLETVLCRWQLETGNREDLPHLTAPICNLKISEDGASYAILLGSNALVVLSTLDLKSTFALRGPTLPLLKHDSHLAPVLPAVAKPNSLPLQLIFATPTTALEELGDTTMNAVYLQTVDARTGTQLERQALTRSNVTDRMSSPSGHFINEPHVGNMAISSDGSWLATVEQWAPPSRDQHMAATEQEAQQLATIKTETFLKFWRRNVDARMWELSARIDNPHGQSAYEAGTVHDLIPTRDGFATIGSDKQIKTWQQKLRVRSNAQVKDLMGVSLTTWYCSTSLATPSVSTVDSVSSAPEVAKLSVSADGSLMVAATHTDGCSILSVIDVAEQKFLKVYSDLPLQNLHSISILDRYLIILSDNLLVHDMVEDKLKFGYVPKGGSGISRQLPVFSHLAVQPETCTFAVTVPKSGSRKSVIAVFNPASESPLTIHQLQRPVRGIFSDPASKGFVVVDGAAEFHQLVPATSANELPVTDEQGESAEAAAASSEKKQPLQIENLALRLSEGDENEDGEGRTAAAATMAAPETNITQAQLQEIFDEVTPLGQAGLETSMFGRIAQLVIGRKAELA